MWGTFSKFNLQKPPKAPSLRCSAKLMQSQRWGYNIRGPFWKKLNKIQKTPSSYFTVMTQLPRKKVKICQSWSKTQSKSQCQSKVEMFNWYEVFVLFCLEWGFCLYIVYLVKAALSPFLNTVRTEVTGALPAQGLTSWYYRHITTLLPLTGLSHIIYSAH